MARLLKLACAIVICMVVATPHAEAGISCSTVVKSLLQCIGFLEGGSEPGSGCCSGVKSLNHLAATPDDRKTACGCLRSAAASFMGSIDLGKAAQLPGKCGVNIGYTISPTIDCSKVN